MHLRLRPFVLVIMGTMMTIILSYSYAQPDTNESCPAFVELALAQLENQLITTINDHSHQTNGMWQPAGIAQDHIHNTYRKDFQPKEGIHGIYDEESPGDVDGRRWVISDKQAGQRQS